LAGATAGSIEGFVTYPTEFAKTQLQFGQQQALQNAATSGTTVAAKVSGLKSTLEWHTRNECSNKHFCDA
jgi:hypothetical protein